MRQFQNLVKSVQLNSVLLSLQCWNQDVKLYTADQLQNLGKLAPGFTADELGMMDLSEDESIEALGKESYTDEQVRRACNGSS